LERRYDKKEGTNLVRDLIRDHIIKRSACIGVQVFRNLRFFNGKCLTLLCIIINKLSLPNCTNHAMLICHCTNVINGYFPKGVELAEHINITRKDEICHEKLTRRARSTHCRTCAEVSPFDCRTVPPSSLNTSAQFWHISVAQKTIINNNAEQMRAIGFYL
jgi:hypothetical protein